MVLDITTSLQSPVVRVALGALAVGLLYTLARELTKIPAKLMVLMATAFLDMVGLLIVVPILPFYARRLGGEGFTKTFIVLKQGGVAVSMIAPADETKAKEQGVTAMMQSVAPFSGGPKCELETKTGVGVSFTTTRSARKVEHTPWRSR